MRGDKNIASSGNGKNKCSAEVHDVPTDVPNYIKKVPSKMDASTCWMDERRFVFDYAILPHIGGAQTLS